MTFELADDPNNQNQIEPNYFDQAEVIKYLNPCSGFEGEEDEDDEDNTKTPYDELAKKMEPLTEDKGVLKTVCVFAPMKLFFIGKFCLFYPILLYQLVKAGQGPVVPDGALVTVHYNAYLEHIDEPFDSTRLRARPFKARYSRCCFFHVVVQNVCKFAE